MKRRLFVGVVVAAVLVGVAAVIAPSIPVPCEYVWPLCLLP